MDNLQTKTEKLLAYGKKQLADKNIESTATTLREVLDEFALVASPSGIIDGTLTQFTNTGVEVIAPYRFYNFSQLQSADFTGATEIGNYACYQCTLLKNLVLPDTITKVGDYAFSNVNNLNLSFEFNPKNECEIGPYAFGSASILKLSGKLGNVGPSAFASCSRLKTINVLINGNLGYFVFSSDANVEALNIDPASNIRAIGSTAFYSVGKYRPNPESNIFDLDFRNSTFNLLDSSAFSSNDTGANANKYYKIRFPKTLTTINDSAFRYTDHFELYFTNETPATLSGTNTFQYATNLSLFVPYTAIVAYRQATNWTTQSANIKGYAEANRFTTGQLLPRYNAEGYELTWYSDKALTQQVTSVTDASLEYYCLAGAERVAVGIKSVYTNQCVLTISDGETTYQAGDGVAFGKVLTITATPTEDGLTPYIFTLNGETITSGATYTAGQDDIKIVAIYWDGVNIPANPTFSENSWEVIKVIAQAGAGASVGWQVGDTKPILINGQEYNIRIADMQAGRYNYTNEERTTNMVFELVEVFPTRYQINNTATNAGGWAESLLRKNLNGLEGGTTSILATLPNDLQSVLEDVQIKSANGGSSNYTSITESANKLFLLSQAEVFSTSEVQYLEEGSRLDYYQDTANSIRIKKRNGSNVSWSLRSPNARNTGGFWLVSSAGSTSVTNADGSNNVSFCFAF